MNTKYFGVGGGTVSRANFHVWFLRQDKNLKMKLKDSVSPVLIEDTSDKNSYYVIMPMKI